MKTHLIFALIIVLVGIFYKAEAQFPTNILDQNVSILAENESLEEVIKNLCKQFNLDYDYNSKLIKGKRVNISMSNKSVREVLNKLMADYYLIFEIENNLLVVRDYVPMSEHVDFEKLYSTPSTGFLFDNKKHKKIEIKFRLISNMIIIPVSINGSDSMNFILDTGVRDPIITELTLVEKLNLNYMKPIELRGLGNEQVTQAYQSGNNTIKIPGLTVEHQKINVVLDETFQISQILGMPVHGLIGLGLFRHYIVEIDYAHEEITLIKPQFFNYKPRKKDIVLPITLTRNKPIINAEVIQQEGKATPVKLLIDTGAGDAIWLSYQSDSSLVLPSNNLYTYLGSGLGGDVYGHKAHLNSLWLGGTILPSAIASYPESNYINNIIRSEKRNGSIGGEILRRFTTVFDFYNERLILRPNTNFDNKFYYNMSGLEVINPVPGVSVYTINSVIENTPAYYAGIKVGDQILKINGQNHRDIELNNINLLLRQKQNKRIRMQVLRNGEKIKTEFYLKEIL